MKFIVAVNASDKENGNGSQTFDIVDTESDMARTNKKKLKEYLSARGIEKKHQKGVLKRLGFYGERLGR